MTDPFADAFAHQKAPAEIVHDPTVCSGEPTFRGTRIPVEIILIHLRAGARIQSVRRDMA